MKPPQLVTRICSHCNRDYTHDQRAHDWRQALCSIDFYVEVRRRQDEIDEIAFESEVSDADSPYCNGEYGWLEDKDELFID